MISADRVSKIAAMLAKRKKAWQLNPPIPLEEVEAIEARYGFALPEEYRLFITQIGNGGQIPPITNRHKTLLPFRDESALQKAGLDFPLSESWEWETDCDFSIDTPEGAEKYSDVEKNGNLVLMRDPGQGGQTWFLVVSGSRRGEVWERDDGGVLRLPECGFLDWIELCLTGKLTPYVNQLFRQEKEKRETRDPLSTIRTLMSGKWGRTIQWRPPAKMSAVRDFEQRHHISLPEDYVTFITEISDGCENFPSANSRGKGGVFYSLEQLDCLPNLDGTFCFAEVTEEIRGRLTNSFRPGAYTWKNPIWTSLFSEIPREDPLSPVWSCKEYSVLHGVLPFGSYNDEQFLRTQPFLIVTGPLRGQVWRTTNFTLRPDGDSFYQWAIKMLKGDAR